MSDQEQPTVSVPEEPTNEEDAIKIADSPVKDAFANVEESAEVKASSAPSQDQDNIVNEDPIIDEPSTAELGSVSGANGLDANSHGSSAKRKRVSSSMGSSQEDIQSPLKKKKRGSSDSPSAAAANSSAVKQGLVKKDKVYCVCKTIYDPSK